MELLDREKVLSLVKMRGPMIPNELRKALGLSETVMVGAVLSELASKGLVHISNTKLGSSPYYYDPNKPESLERISQHLGEKDQRAFNLLKEKLILRDDRQDALVRVCLRNIKDFSRMLTINAPEGQVVYWKYFLLSDSDAEQMIKEDLGIAAAKPEPSPTPKEPEPVKPTPIPEARPAEPAVAPPPPPEPTTPTHSTHPPKTQSQATERREKESQEELPTELEKIHDEFYAKVKRYFDRNNITIIEQKLIRKNSEIDFVIQLPTPVGNVEYYCKAKAKKKSNDGDLASAKLQGNSKNLPVIYLTTGEITKKAKEKLRNDFKGLVVKEL